MPYGNLLADVVQSSTTGTPPQFNDGNGTQTGTLCRAWVNFNGTGTVAIRASFNVSSITDNGTGDYTVNFTTAMPDVNYSATGNVGNNNIRCVLCFTSTATYLTSSVRIQAIDPQTSAGVDEAIVTLAVFR
jgi:hypothetical protein